MKEFIKLPEPNNEIPKGGDSDEYNRGFYAGAITGVFLTFFILIILYLKN